MKAYFIPIAIGLAIISGLITITALSRAEVQHTTVAQAQRSTQPPQPPKEQPPQKTDPNPPQSPAPAPQPTPKPQPQPQAQSKPAPQPAQPSRYDVGPPDKDEIIELVNNERTAKGLKPLVVTPAIAASAQTQTNYMARVKEVTHRGALHRLINQVKHCGIAAENAQGQGPKNTSRDALQMWKKSPKHYAAMLGDYRRTGMGITLRDDTYYISIQFCQY